MVTVLEKPVHYVRRNMRRFYFTPEVQCHNSLLIIIAKMVVMVYDMIILYYIDLTIKIIDEYDYCN